MDGENGNAQEEGHVAKKQKGESSNKKGKKTATAAILQQQLSFNTHVIPTIPNLEAQDVIPQGPITRSMTRKLALWLSNTVLQQQLSVNASLQQLLTATGSIRSPSQQQEVAKSDNNANPPHQQQQILNPQQKQLSFNGLLLPQQQNPNPQLLQQQQQKYCNAQLLQRRISPYLHQHHQQQQQQLPSLAANYSSKEISAALVQPGLARNNFQQFQPNHMNQSSILTNLHSQFTGTANRTSLSTVGQNIAGDAPAVTSSRMMPGFIGNTLQMNKGTTPNVSRKTGLDILGGPDGQLPAKIRHIDANLLERIINEIIDQNLNVSWDDIAGLEHAKKSVTEMIVWPLIRPDIFKGCRAPGRGLLLFGPPGNGKTMVGKAIAGEVKATFFHVNASTFASKSLGDSEKIVRALFGVAQCMKPAIIFLDEIDSILSKRGSMEHESYRRVKTQFLIEMEGIDTENDQVLLIGATNRPQDLDEAARRRLSRRLYIPLPSPEARAYIVRNLLEKDELFALSEEDMDVICQLTEGYSSSDMKNLVKDAVMGPLRDAMKQGIDDITKLNAENLRQVTVEDFQAGTQAVRPSVSPSEISSFVDWNLQFGNMSL